MVVFSVHQIAVNVRNGGGCAVGEIDGTTHVPRIVFISPSRMKPDDDTMHSRITLRLIVPFERAVGEVNLNVEVLPQQRYLLTLRNRVRRDERTAS